MRLTSYQNIKEMIKQLSRVSSLLLQNIQLKIMLMACILVANLKALAQDGELDIDISVNEPEWYENIWIWIGLAVFIIIIVAIVSAGRKK
ncbi:hypothetical protein D770_07660 [Flammeovirgaceae bacterium 311]|nr:hypothetical protein D770_07660 [Flammeovirgaceae bacterium 311]